MIDWKYEIGESIAYMDVYPDSTELMHHKIKERVWLRGERAYLLHNGRVILESAIIVEQP